MFPSPTSFANVSNKALMNYKDEHFVRRNIDFEIVRTSRLRITSDRLSPPSLINMCVTRTASRTITGSSSIRRPSSSGITWAGSGFGGGTVCISAYWGCAGSWCWGIRSYGAGPWCIGPLPIESRLRTDAARELNPESRCEWQAALLEYGSSSHIDVWVSGLIGWSWFERSGWCMFGWQPNGTWWWCCCCCCCMGGGGGG